MTMKPESYELQTVQQVARRLCMSDQGVRRLAQCGKLSAVSAGRRRLFSEEALEAYAARRGHPLPVIAAMNHAQGYLWMGGMIRNASGASGHGVHLYLPPSTTRFYRVLFPEVEPVCQALLSAAKRKNYAQVAVLDGELINLQTDYDMEHAPISTPQVKASKRTPQPSEQPPLFPGLS